MDIIQDSLANCDNLEYETENSNLEDLLMRLKDAFAVSEDLIVNMKRARQRSSEAARAGTSKGPESIGKRLETARGELRELEEFRASLNEAGTFVSLEECASKLEFDLSQATRVLRQLQSTNNRRDLELSRQTEVDTAALEDQVRRDLLAVRSRNTTLTKTIQNRENALADLADSEKGFRLRISQLRETVKERDILKAKLAELRKQESQSSNYHVSPMTAIRQSRDFPREAVSVDEPDIVSAVATSEDRCIHIKTTPVDILIQDNLAPVDIPIQKDATPVDIPIQKDSPHADPTDEADRIEDILTDEPSGILGESSFAFPEVKESPSELQVDEPVHSVVPRRLFQSESVQNEDVILGPHDFSDDVGCSYLPPVHVPVLFQVSARSVN